MGQDEFSIMSEEGLNILKKYQEEFRNNVEELKKELDKESYSKLLKIIKYTREITIIKERRNFFIEVEKIKTQTEKIILK